jgi:hypothetical protein
MWGGSMRGALAICCCILTLGSALAGASTNGRPTNTTGQVCSPSSGCGDHTLERYGGYAYKGTTRPSERGQEVTFWFRRVGTKKWHRFGRYTQGSGPQAFQSLEDSRDASTNQKGRWSLSFSAYKEGRWVLKAVFYRQDDYLRSSDTWPVTVEGGE